MTIIAERSRSMGGTQVIHRFPNNYGASVVRGYGTYGNEKELFELAVLKFTGPGTDDFHLTYDTPITSDVEGYLTPKAVENLLAKIEALPPVNKEVAHATPAEAP